MGVMPNSTATRAATPTRSLPTGTVATRREAADLLLGPDAGDLLAAAVGTTGAALTSWELHAVHARPGAETSVGYTVHVAAAGAAEPAEGYLVATTADLPATPGVVRLAPAGACADGALHVWRHPGDPMLPGLADACTPELLTARLRAAGDDVEVLDVEVLAYRPMRRAVVRAHTSGGDRFVKVLRPTGARALVRRLGALAVTGLAPATTAVDLDAGIVVLARASGLPLTQHLVGGGSADPAQVLALLDGLPAGVTALERRAAWADRVETYAASLTERFPDTLAAATEVVDAVRYVRATTDPGPVVPTHGDLHPANLWWAGDAPSALIDVDTLGPGHRVDDLACLVAHLSVLPTLDARYTTVPACLEELLAAFDAVVDPAGLRARAAAVVLSLAASQPDEDLARRWLARATTFVPRSPAGETLPHRGTAQRRAS